MTDPGDRRPGEPPHGGSSYPPHGTPPGGPHRPEPGKAAKAVDATGRAARASGRLAKKSVAKARRVTHAHGAGESGMARLLEVHAFNTAGDAAVAVALAGSLFFSVPTGEARPKVALFLLMTMLPFAIVAPLIGPFLDRFRRGRKVAIGVILGTSALCCWVLAGSVDDESIAMYPAALGVLVASKAYGVTKASAVPRVLPEGFTLVKANSRISLVGTGAAVISAPLAAGAAQVGAAWALRYAFLIFVIGAVLTWWLPAKVNSPEGEEQVSMAEMRGGTRGMRVGITSTVIGALRSNAGVRFTSGFLVMYMAFVLREHPFDGWEDHATWLLALVIGAAGLGNLVGTVIGSMLKARKPELTVVVVLLVDAAMVTVTALLYSLATAVVLGLTVGICQSLGKLSLDAVIQRDVPEAVRTSVFGRSETLLQLSWVMGGFLGIALPLTPTPLGLGTAAALLVIWSVIVLQYVLSRRDPPAPRPGESAGPTAQSPSWAADETQRMRQPPPDGPTQQYGPTTRPHDPTQPMRRRRGRR
ncbi:MAG TPA: MFS transporter [Nocardioidaceae bacterium]|nr:MFS transporter [Nocardioidaceae bacterium]